MQWEVSTARTHRSTQERNVDARTQVPRRNLFFNLANSLLSTFSPIQKGGGGFGVSGIMGRSERGDPRCLKASNKGIETLNQKIGKMEWRNLRV